MQIQRSSNRHRDGGVVAKKDLLIVGIFTAVVSGMGVSQLLFQSGGATLLILLALLSAAGLYVLWRRSAKTESASRAPVEDTSSKPHSAVLRREAIAPNLFKQLGGGLAFIAVLCGAGVVVTGATMGSVVLVSIGLLSLIGALTTFLYGQASRSRSGQA